MLYKVGRFLQMAALLILPIGIMGNVMEKLSLKESLIVSGLGMAVFLVGWLVQQAAPPP